jgi:hypothetical protein
MMPRQRDQHPPKTFGVSPPFCLT